MSAATQTFRPDLVPTWAKVAAWLVPVTTLPSITWRMNTIVGGLMSGENPCVPPHTTLWEKVYLLAGLPSLQLGLALLTIGLIRPWGEVFPHWLPVIGGRVVPVALAVRTATTGAGLVLIIATSMAFPRLSDACGMRWAWTGRRARHHCRTAARCRAGRSLAGICRWRCGHHYCWQ